MLNKYPVLKTVNKFILPFIIFFALYIQICGEDSPGGGFQSGAIFASSLIVIRFTSGIDYNKKHLMQLSAIGVMIYFITGLASLIKGKNYLDYNVLHIDHIIAQKIGIFIIELGVGITVSSSILLIYLLFDED